MHCIKALHIIAVGIGATAVMDAWAYALRRLSIPTLDYALVGRWVGHMAQGTFTHAAIGRATPVRGERPLGWLVHYGAGVAFAAALVAVQGVSWLRTPTLMPALAAGLITVVVPWLVMQPAFGGGVLGLKTAAPLANGMRSLATHAVFGAGLFLAAKALTGLTQ